MSAVKKFGFLFLLTATMLAIPGCNKEENIVGTWSGYDPIEEISYTYTFNADGSYTLTGIWELHIQQRIILSDNDR